MWYSRPEWTTHTKIIDCWARWRRRSGVMPLSSITKFRSGTATSDDPIATCLSRRSWARRKVSLLNEHYQSQRDRDWWDDETFLATHAHSRNGVPEPLRRSIPNVEGRAVCRLTPGDLRRSGPAFLDGACPARLGHLRGSSRSPQIWSSTSLSLSARRTASATIVSVGSDAPVSGKDRGSGNKEVVDRMDDGVHHSLPWIYVHPGGAEMVMHALDEGGAVLLVVHTTYPSACDRKAASITLTEMLNGST